MRRGRAYYVYEDVFVKGMCSVEGDELSELYVEPFFTGEGIGTQLLRFAVQECGARRLWVLENNKRGIDFYLSRGFATTDERVEAQGTGEYVVRLERQRRR